MATLLYRYSVNQRWSTYAPTIMTIKRAHSLRDRLLREGNIVKVKYL